MDQRSGPPFEAGLDRGGLLKVELGPAPCRLGLEDGPGEQADQFGPLDEVVAG